MRSPHRLFLTCALGISLALTSAPAQSIATPNSGSAAQERPTERPQLSKDPAWPVDTRGDGCAAPVWPAAPPSARKQRLLVIGDSLIRNSKSTLKTEASRAGWIPTVRCWGAKGTDWGLQQVKRARQLRHLPRTVVISLGTNDIWWLGLDLGRGVDAIVRELGPDRQIYWVNLWFGPHNYDRLPSPKAANRLLRAKAKQYPNLKIVNFAKAFRDAKAQGRPVGWLDGVHLNEPGNRLRVEAIVAAIGSPPSTRTR